MKVLSHEDQTPTAPSAAANSRNQSRQNEEGGWTLVELAIVLTILIALASLYVTSYDPAKTNGKLLYTQLSSLGSSMLHMKTDTSCYPLTTNALFVKAAAANSQCGIDMTSQWQGPYHAATSVDAAGDITLPKISPNVTITIGQGSNLNGDGNTVQWYLQANNVPNDVIKNAMDACNGTGTANGQCVGSPGAGATGTGTVQYIFDEHN